MGLVGGARLVVVVVDGDLEVSITLGKRRPDLGLVEELARLRLMAGQLGYTFRLDNPCSTVRELLDLVGLGELSTAGSDSALEAGRKPESREQLGVEEVVEPGDPSGGDFEHLEGEGLEES